MDGGKCPGKSPPPPPPNYAIAPPPFKKRERHLPTVADPVQLYDSQHHPLVDP
jgi:hypothetical protein